MIKISEIRIGNFIIQNPEEPVIVQILDDSHFSFVYKYPEDCIPIKLTPKILEWFGFTKQKIRNPNITSNTTEYRTILEFIFKNIEFVIDTQNFKLKVKMIKGNEYFPIFSVIHIHQFQNLFFALTGIELNDIVAYNYYLKQFDDINNAVSFETFISYLSLDTKLKLGNYSFGDLPPNLFQIQ